MSCEKESEKKCFTLIWKVENANYGWHEKNKSIVSPCLVLDETDGAKWLLMLYLGYGRGGNFVSLYLENESGYRSEKGHRNEETAVFIWELAFLSLDGKVVLSNNNSVLRSKFSGLCMKREDLFRSKRSEFLPQDTLTARLRIWKSDGETLDHEQHVARTQIGVEKRSFMWQIRNFSILKPGDKCTYEIKTSDKRTHLMSLDLFLTGELNSEVIRFAISTKERKINSCTFHMSLEQDSGNEIECLKDEFRFDSLDECKPFTKFLTKKMLMEKKVKILPNDVLSLECRCCFTSGILTTEIEGVSTDCTTYKMTETETSSVDKEDVLPEFHKVLNDELKSMLMDSIHSDIKLRTSSKSYPAHKCILSSRSRVFKAMFSNDTREKINDYIDIGDLNDDTVLRMLQYIYSAEVEDLEWDDATELYRAADKYQILTLKDICSSYFKTRLCPSNACKALLLADLHRDEDLKSFVQNFILRYVKDIMNSEEWKDLMKTNLKLAAETMYLKYKE